MKSARTLRTVTSTGCSAILFSSADSADPAGGRDSYCSENARPTNGRYPEARARQAGDPAGSLRADPEEDRADSPGPAHSLAREEAHSRIHSPEEALHRGRPCNPRTPAARRHNPWEHKPRGLGPRGPASSGEPVPSESVDFSSVPEPHR